MKQIFTQISQISGEWRVRSGESFVLVLVLVWVWVYPRMARMILTRISQRERRLRKGW